MVEKKSETVRNMFGSIAHRYDLLNHLLSLSVDRYWRWVTARRLGAALPVDPLVLDLCTGTGDLALLMARRARVVGCDFCHPMLVLGAGKATRNRLDGRVCFLEGDALCLPFAAGQFDAVTVAFGLRNLEDYAHGLREMARVLRPGGMLAVLEFSQPRLPLFRPLYLFYFTRILPRLGRWISGSEGPYSYLPASVQEFPDPDHLDRLIQESGFTQVGHCSLTGGIAVLHRGEKGRG